MASKDREKLKRELSRNQVRGGSYGAPDRLEVLEQEYKKKRLIRFWVIVGTIIIIIIAAAAAFLLNRYHRFTEYSLKWETELPEGSFVGCRHFGENVIKYSQDGASYLGRDGKAKWIDSYEMNNPGIYVSGEYACIYDIQGSQIRIYDETGQIGAADTVMPVTKAVVSEAGNCAAILEDDDASYINFFKKDGSEQDISIKTRLAGDGYPMDIALSPEGTQLITAFAYLEGAAFRSKVVFYDFSEIGKNIPNRLVGGFEEPFDESLVARVRFLNDTYSYAVADTGIYFFSSRNLSSPELVKQVRTGEHIENIINYNDEVAVVYSDLETDEEINEREKAEEEAAKAAEEDDAETGTEKATKSGTGDAAKADSDKDKDSGAGTGDGQAGANTESEAYRLVLYKGDGSQSLNKKFTCSYDHADTDGTYFYFKGADTLDIFNQYGIVKYSGSMDDEAHVITKAQSAGCFIFNGSNYVREYQFK